MTTEAFKTDDMIGFVHPNKEIIVFNMAFPATFILTFQTMRFIYSRNRNTTL